ncbi:MAG: hypothetical protein P4L84_35965, partial [Isosphaeraceae bacterium]|nr:hypothetical protein [Isosphaeraceae bacterium]
MPRRPSKPAATRRPSRGQATSSGRAWGRWLISGVAALVLAGGLWALVPDGPEGLRARAEAAERAGEWSRALPLWRAVNRTRLARGRTHLAEARACLALD